MSLSGGKALVPNSESPLSFWEFFTRRREKNYFNTLGRYSPYIKVTGNFSTLCVGFEPKVAITLDHPALSPTAAIFQSSDNHFTGDSIDF